MDMQNISKGELQSAVNESMLAMMQGGQFRDILAGVVTDILEDRYFGAMIEKSRSSELVSADEEKEIYKILRGE